jgi:K+-transporting ATPase ATPase A chain
MLMYAVVAVFIAGLMVGRTPEYVGKKIEQYEVRMAILAILILVANTLFWLALATNLNPPAAWNHVNNSSPSVMEGATYNNVNNNAAHGFTEMLYAYCSATGNNGSAFAGLTANTPYYNVTLGLAMLVGRYLMMIPLLALAGSLVRKKVVPVSAGTLATGTLLFAVLLAAIVIVVGALEFFPALSLGPIAEHLQMLAGKLF